MLAIGGILFIFMFVNLGLRPLASKIGQIQQEVKIAELKLKEGLSIQMRKDQIIDEYNRLQTYLKQGDYSEQEIVGSFLKELERLTQQSNISVISLSPAEAKERENRKVYNADLRAEGDIEGILNFFNRIQESRLLIKIEKLSLSPKDKDAIELELDTKISMVRP